MLPRELTICSENCKYFNKDLPRNIGTPTCRLFEKYNKEKNPVTKAVLRDIIRKRLRCDNGGVAESG